MKMKSILSTVLFVFIAISLIFLHLDSKNKRGNLYLVNAEAAVDNLSKTNVTTSHNSQSAPVLIADNKEKDKSVSKAPIEKPKTAKETKDTDYVYYFMTTARCPSCMKIEAFTKEAVNENFSNDLKKGTLKWEMIQVDKKGNEHYVKDYELYTKSVVLVKMRGGKQVSWKNLDKVWSLLGNKIAFKKYITDEITSFVGKG
jgi:hypothetical protein